MTTDNTDLQEIEETDNYNGLICAKFGSGKSFVINEIAYEMFLKRETTDNPNNHRRIA